MSFFNRTFFPFCMYYAIAGAQVQKTVHHMDTEPSLAFLHSNPVAYKLSFFAKHRNPQVFNRRANFLGTLLFESPVVRRALQPSADYLAIPIMSRPSPQHVMACSAEDGARLLWGFLSLHGLYVASGLWPQPSAEVSDLYDGLDEHFLTEALCADESIGPAVAKLQELLAKRGLYTEPQTHCPF
jgi:hypothetical protein